MSTELVEVQERPLSKDQMLAQVRTVQEVMKTVMKDGEHYGIVPGCGNKPTLLKAGSEKLLHTFGFGTEVHVEDMFPGDPERVGYRVRVTVRSRDGRLMGSGVGEASSEEQKWKWREAVCQEEFDEKMDDERRKKWKKSYGKVETILQIKNNPYDLSNTILKMAKKRAQIDATLTVCACSDIFSQDLEEMADNGQAPNRGSRPAQASQNAPSVPRTPRYGPEPDVPITEVGHDHLLTYAEGLQKALDIEPDQEILETDDVNLVEKKQKFNAAQAKKRKFQKQNQALYDAMVAELRTREAKAANTEEAPPEAQG